MSSDESLLEKLQKLLRWKKSKKFYAEKLGCTEEDVEVLMKELKERDQQDDDLIEYTTEVDVEKGIMKSSVVVDYEPKDHNELAKLHKIDLTKFIITNYWSKLKPNGKFTSSVFCRKKQTNDYTTEDFSKFLENYKPEPTQIDKLKKDEGRCHVDVELSIFDYHLAKKTLDGTNTLKERANVFYIIAEELIAKASNIYNLNTVIFPISNDFFHTDNYQNSTTNGTPQDVIEGYDIEYEVGFDLLVRTINMIRKYANDVTILLVQGNHDRTKSFYLAHALDVYFKDDLDVNFIRHHSVTKAVTLGNTFIGYHHGNKCKLEDLPLLFATSEEYSCDFGTAKYREVHTGDKHHYMAKEVKGVRIQQMPSLSGVDRWHLDNNYVNNIKAAVLTAYHPETGRVCELEKRI